MSIKSPTLRYPKSLWSYNPIPGRDCLLYLPLWHPSLRGPIFRSIGPVSYDLTAVNATQNADGRVFANTGKLTITGSQLFNTSKGTIITWRKTSETTSNTSWCSADTGTTNYYFSDEMYTGGIVAILQKNNDTASNIRSTTGGYGDGAAHMVAFVSSGTAYRINVDGVELGIDINVGANNGDWFADTTLRDDYKIGLFYRTTESSQFGGTIMEQAIYGEDLSSGELMYWFQQTRGRHQ